MIAVFALGAFFVLACLFAFGTYIIQFGAAALILLFRLLIAVAQGVGLLLAGIVWVGWFITSPKTAMASYRKEKGAREVGKAADEPSPYGDKPFRRRRARLTTETTDA